jgi:hypothetical protein
MISVRKFNPRLLPYNLVKHKDNNENIISDDDFPSLGKK